MRIARTRRFSRKLIALTGVPTLYIQAVDDPELAETTRQMFLKAPEPREPGDYCAWEFCELGG